MTEDIVKRLREHCVGGKGTALEAAADEIERLTRERDDELAQRLAWEARAESAEKKIAAVGRLLAHHFVVAEAGDHEITDEVGISIRLLQQIEGVFRERRRTMAIKWKLDAIKAALRAYVKPYSDDKFVDMHDAVEAVIKAIAELRVDLEAERAQHTLTMDRAREEYRNLTQQVERLTRERDEALDALDTLVMHGHPFGADNASMIVPKIEWEAVEIKLRAIKGTETKE